MQVRDNAIVYGGGAAEVACGLAVSEASNNVVGQEQFAMRAFVKALDSIPLALAENAGALPVPLVSLTCTLSYVAILRCVRSSRRLTRSRWPSRRTQVRCQWHSTVW